MQRVGPAGFFNTPVSKGFVLFIGGCSIITAILKSKQYFYLQLEPHLTVYYQYWRIVTSHMAFGSSGDLFFGILLLYALRVLERQYGSSKYIAFLFISWAISTILELISLALCSQFGLNRIRGGPYALIFAMLYQYYRIIPVTYKFRVFGIIMTDKIFLYIIAAHLALSGISQTLVPVLCGLIAGAVYRTDIANLKRWRFPVALQRFTSRYLKPFLSTSPIARSSATTPDQRPILTPVMGSWAIRNRNNVNRGADAVSLNGDMETATNSTATVGHPTGVPSVRDYLDTITGRDMAGSDMEPPSPEYTRILMTMFPNHPRESITRALSQSRNNLNRAVEIMLSTPAPN
ncbi:hypothetical protein BDF20DRAFT_897590 [Mycotypha africana]|uniref:uncharacterized protein n=1 Tax=Mycotypha africana TaxID=64632 RepID=UPI00230061F6|nr:uncharacterized protein BDF20DRAFT_897590 [Mycotypha africana]KAI8967879.1 hypothetical protein BDF20DRAFT_897590 [Mycotypha africana]